MSVAFYQSTFETGARAGANVTINGVPFFVPSDPGASEGFISHNNAVRALRRAGIRACVCATRW